MPALSELQNLHYAERVVMKNVEFMETIEAAMRAVAVEIYQEPPDTWGHDNRAAIAVNIAMSGADEQSEAKRFRNLFATVVLQHEPLRGQFFDATSPTDANKTMESRIMPWMMDEATLQNVIRGAWNVAANVPAEPEPEPETGGGEEAPAE